ncbi:MAG TPA: hypothetical protein VF170_18320 [Planctomycetaceae bacterium]
MIALRLLLNLTLVVALAAVCPIRCQADAARAIGVAAVECDGCPCCPVEDSEAPEAPAPDECADCVCDGAVDGPRVAAVECSAALPGDLPASRPGDPVRLAAGSLESLDARPDAPDGATLRLLLASLVI